MLTFKLRKCNPILLDVSARLEPGNLSLLLWQQNLLNLTDAWQSCWEQAYAVCLHSQIQEQWMIFSYKISLVISRRSNKLHRKYCVHYNSCTAKLLEGIRFWLCLCKGGLLEQRIADFDRTCNFTVERVYGYCNAFSLSRFQNS